MNRKVFTDDLIGKTFNKLTILSESKERQNSDHLVLCRCMCGAEKLRITSQVIKGKQTSCGAGPCRKRPVHTGQRATAMIGKKFGKLEILCTLGANRVGSQRIRCKCDCGTVLQASAYEVSAGIKKSCSMGECHPRLIDLRGQQFHYLTAMHLHRTMQNSTYWVFRCICGTEKPIQAQLVRQGKQKSCGCKNAELGLAALRKRKSALDSVMKKNYGWHVRNAKTRGFSKWLTFEEWKNVAVMPCVYCGHMESKKSATGESIDLNSVDRTNNETFYDLENCHSCCYTCNRMKLDLTEKSFLDRIKKIHAYKGL